MLIEEFDPRVLIIDDRETDTISIQEALRQRYVGYKFIDASPENLKTPEKPFGGVELVFLDLYYNDRFDPEICAQIIQSALAQNTYYTLVIWSKDTHEAQLVVDELKLINLSPYQTIIKQKSNFFEGGHRYNVEELLSQINHEAEERVRTEVIRGEIVIIDDESVVIDCLISNEGEEKNIQLRRFEKEPFLKVVDLQAGNYIIIKIITKPGSKTFEFSGTDDDLSSLFSKDDLFNDEDLSTYYGN